MNRRIPVAIAFVALWAVLAVSCAGRELSRDEYGSELRSTMQELEETYGNAGEALQAQPTDDSATVGDIIADLEATQVALRDAANRLDEIEPPSDLVADHDALIAGVRDMADAIDLLVEAQELAATDEARAAQLARDFASDDSFEVVQAAAARLEEAGVDAGL